jgi:hypothetical protein
LPKKTNYYDDYDVVVTASGLKIPNGGKTVWKVEHLKITFGPLAMKRGWERLDPFGNTGIASL